MLGLAQILLKKYYRGAVPRPDMSIRLSSQIYRLQTKGVIFIPKPKTFGGTLTAPDHATVVLVNR